MIPEQLTLWSEPERRLLYHCTPRRNLLAIKRWGLIPRDTTQHNYPLLAFEDAPAVFAWPTRQRALEWGLWQSGAEPEPHVIVVFDARGFRTQTDPRLFGALRLSERVTADRVMAVIAPC